MDEFIDHYKILCINRNASSEAIKRSYRKLALRFHPDVCKLVHAQDRFIEIQEAYEILGDQLRRHYYNIIFDDYYQLSKESVSDKYAQTKIKNDYQNWRSAANNVARNLSKDKFDLAKEKIFENIGQTVDEARNILTYIFMLSFIGATFYGLYASYSRIDIWSIEKNGNAIAGFVVCSILVLLFVIVAIISVINKIKNR